ncbi:MAG: 4-hydroxy-3-methylbut-2-enyl diphosphate reductase [Candidatus Firestonebacteria bacterium]
MKVYLAENAGFCFGVKRAINLAGETAKNTKGKVCTFGPIIHNPQVVTEFKRKGIIAVEDVSRIKEGSSIIIRTHGVSPDKVKEFKKKKLKIIDATCPFVKKAQKFAKQLTTEGYQVIVIGESEHPEVKGIRGFTQLEKSANRIHNKNKAIVIGSVCEVKKLPKLQRIGIVVQTTQSPENFKNIVMCLLEKSNELKIFNTICDATKKRQNSSLKLTKKVDIIIVIGGYNSANTKHLAEVCESTAVPTYHIESSLDLKKDWFKGKKRVGITAGASTPDWVINEVVKNLKRLKI